MWKRIAAVPSNDVQSRTVQYFINIEKLENEFLLTSAEHLLSLANVKSTFTGKSYFVCLISCIWSAMPSMTENIDLRIDVVLKFWKGSRLKRELERVFFALSLKCCPNRVGSSFIGNDIRTHSLLLTSSEDKAFIHGSVDTNPSSHQSKGNSQWETLELYLEKYKKLHPRLPVIVAETLLYTDPQMELPLWLVQMFKGSRRATSWGMAGQESGPASLFQLYVDCGRYTEATNLLLEYIESFASPDGHLLS
ncbi:hypothetical protein HHK36_028353 [Tetracentron sinense]|uniref:NUP160 C-terminal TPR domain-containing protein n=1 Tax=Tetracentron sinense TaxID=13715 RepID=A0A835D3D6_TETSI|nr:hypothetical protein HHK36_028353 [Tetracentron sinense]